MIFKTEKDLVNQFCYLFQQYNLKKEVKNSNWAITDIVLYVNNIKIAFEAKLNNIVDVWVQALRNKSLYDYSYVVLPSIKRNLILKKYIEVFKKYQIGIVLIDYQNCEFLFKVENILIEN